MNTVSLPFSASQIFEDGEPRRALEERALPQYLPQRRWFGAKARTPQRFRIVEMVAVRQRVFDSAFGHSARLALIRVEYADGGAETYALPMLTTGDEQARETLEKSAPEAIIATLEGGEILFDAIHAPEFPSGLLALLASGEAEPGELGELAGIPGRGLPEGAEQFTSRVLKVEQSNSSIVYGPGAGKPDQIFVKLFRKLEDGMNPDVEITRFLFEEQKFPHVPPFAGMIKYRRPDGEPQVLALALGMVPNDGDAWALTLREVKAFYDRVREQGSSAPDPSQLGLFDSTPAPENLKQLVGSFAERAAQLGQRTGQMHLALAADHRDHAFAPEPITHDDLRAFGEEVRTSSERVWGLISEAAKRGSVSRDELANFQPVETNILARADRLGASTVNAVKTRTHGDYHLGQVLNTGEDFVIIDFEGEPLRPLAERKAKKSPLRDVAGMLRSFHYAAHGGLSEAKDSKQLLPWAEAWAATISRTFLQAWRETTAGAPIVPPTEEEFRLLLEGYLLEKALYEVAYELNNRPTWVGIPLRGIAAVLSA